MSDSNESPDQSVQTEKCPYDVGREMSAEVVNNVTLALGGAKLVTSYLMPKLIRDHWAFKVKTKVEPGSKDLAGAMNIWAAMAVHIFMPVEERENYTKFRRDNKIPGFAGDKADLILPCANIWYEAGYAAGSYPTLVPVRDNVAYNVIKIRRIALLATHRHANDPFALPATENDPRFLRDAYVIAFIEDALGGIHTYAGYVSYGIGGANMWRVENLEDLGRALNNMSPKDEIIPPPMSNLAQFACGELAYMLNFYGNETPEAFRAAYTNGDAVENTEDYDESATA